MVVIRASRLQCHSRHTSEQSSEYLLEIISDTRLQDPSSVIAYPYYVVCEGVYRVTLLFVLHVDTSIVPKTNSFIYG